VVPTGDREATEVGRRAMTGTNIIPRLLVTALGGVTAATIGASAVAMSAATGKAPRSTVALNRQPFPPGRHQLEPRDVMLAGVEEPPDPCGACLGDGSVRHQHVTLAVLQQQQPPDPCRRGCGDYDSTGIHRYTITLAAAHKSPGRNKVASLPPAS
jgi:hypothetical protein